MLELVGLGVFSHNTGADLACSDLSPYTGADIHESGFALGLALKCSFPYMCIGLGMFSLTLELIWLGIPILVPISTGVDWPWNVFSHNTAVECSLSQYWLGVISLPTLELISTGVD